MPLGEKRQLHIAQGIANGMAFLHSHSVAHRDLKGSNVLYDRQVRPPPHTYFPIVGDCPTVVGPLPVAAALKSQL